MGNLNPKSSITRAEVVTIIDNMIEVYLTGGGERDCELIGEISGNVLVNTAGTTVKNLTTTGNLYITEGVGSGDVTLDNVTVGGTTFVRGGGANSIHIIGGGFNIIILDSGTNTHLANDERLVCDRRNRRQNGSIFGDFYAESFWSGTAAWDFTTSSDWKMGTTIIDSGYTLPVLYWKNSDKAPDIPVYDGKIYILGGTISRPADGVLYLNNLNVVAALTLKMEAGGAATVYWHSTTILGPTPTVIIETGVTVIVHSGADIDTGSELKINYTADEAYYYNLNK